MPTIPHCPADPGAHGRTCVGGGARKAVLPLTASAVGCAAGVFAEKEYHNQRVRESLFGRRPPPATLLFRPPGWRPAVCVCPTERGGPRSLPLMRRVIEPWLWNTGPPRANEDTPSTASPPLSCHCWRCRVTMPLRGRDGGAGGRSRIPDIVGIHGGRSKPCHPWISTLPPWRGQVPPVAAPRPGFSFRPPRWL